MKKLKKDYIIISSYLLNYVHKLFLHALSASLGKGEFDIKIFNQYIRLAVNFADWDTYIHSFTSLSSTFEDPEIYDNAGPGIVFHYNKNDYIVINFDQKDLEYLYEFKFD